MLLEAEFNLRNLEAHSEQVARWKTSSQPMWTMPLKER